MARVWIDPGHGGGDPGAMGPGNRLEKEDNLRYALALRELLEARGVSCVMTREGDEWIGYADRCAASEGCELAICCHRNAGPATATGAEIWLHHSVTGGAIAEWASDVIAGLEDAGMLIRAGSIARGVYRGYRSDPNADYYCNSGTICPSMLIELGFVTNPADNALFDSRLPALVRAIADAACRKLGVAWREDEEKPSLYRVQVGAFASPENARRLAEELGGKGYQTVIKAE